MGGQDHSSGLKGDHFKFDNEQRTKIICSRLIWQMELAQELS